MATRKTGDKLRRRRAPSRPMAAERAGTPGGTATPGSPSPPGTPPATRQRAIRDALPVLALGLLIAVSYYPATQGGFVWDDIVFTLTRSVQDVSGLWKIWFEPRSIEHEGHYWPILYTTFWVEHKLWGFEPPGYHIVNLLLHLGVTLLLWRLLLKLAVPGAWVVAAVFAVHPLHVESVAWVMGRKDLLASLFYLAAVLRYLRFVEHGHRVHYAQALGLSVLSLLSKSIAVTLPISLLIWHWWTRDRVTRADVVRVAPFLVVGLGIIIADLLYYKGIDDTSFDHSVIERVLIASRALWFYAGKLVWPTWLSVIYPRWDISATDPLDWGAWLGAIAVVALLWWFRHRIGRGPLAGMLFFAVTLSPTLGFIDYGYMLFAFVADRYQYLAGSGVIAVLVSAAAHGTNLLPGVWKMGVQAVTVAGLIVLGTLTWQQASIYETNITFYSHITRLNPVARLTHYNLALEYQKEGRHEEALAMFRAEHRLAVHHPSDSIRNSRAHLGIGKASEDLGQLEEAEKHYERALEISPRFPTVIEHMGAFRIRQRRYQEALDFFHDLIRIKPMHAKFYVGRGVSLAGLKRHEEALRSYDHAIELDPTLQEARTNRENLLKEIQRARQAPHR
ncbi:MAG: tetratricopeptide repeat protein [Nitrospira sp.]|nr:tetratricopeptide repeat protein [Nitrospira sp.]